MSQSQDLAEQNIQVWKVKKLIKSLDAARGFVFSILIRSKNATDRWVQSWDFNDLVDHPSKGT